LAGKWWINRNALLLNLSAFFADMGYQAVIAAFPILIVIVFHAPVYILGIAYAITFGIGSIFGYIGGILGDKLGRKRMAILGNLFIPILSFTGLAANYAESMSLFFSGWWARDFRTPPRRAMLSEATTKNTRGKAFGSLHAFDIGGGAIAVGYLILLLSMKWQMQRILLITAIPLLVSTLCLLFVTVGKRKNTIQTGNKIQNANREKVRINRSTMIGVLVATSLFGFSFYNLGFPILTIAQSSNNIYGIASYMIYLAFSAVSGYVIGTMARKLNLVKSLSLLGYALAAFGSLLIGLSYLMHLHLLFSYIAVAMIGIALGVIETFEPTILSVISPKQNTSKTLGYLTSSRSIGLFMGNVIMGLLYVLNPFYSYMYAFVVALAAAIIMFMLGKDFRM
jgi:MFS family permease